MQNMKHMSPRRQLFGHLGPLKRMHFSVKLQNKSGSYIRRTKAVACRRAHSRSCGGLASHLKGGGFKPRCREFLTAFAKYIVYSIFPENNSSVNIDRVCSRDSFEYRNC